MNSKDANTDQDLFRIDDLLARYGVSRQTIENWSKFFSFPDPHIRISAKARYWLKSEVIAWERARTSITTQAA